MGDSFRGATWISMSNAQHSGLYVFLVKGDICLGHNFHFIQLRWVALQPELIYKGPSKIRVRLHTAAFKKILYDSIPHWPSVSNEDMMNGV